MVWACSVQQTLLLGLAEAWPGSFCSTDCCVSPAAGHR